MRSSTNSTSIHNNLDTNITDNSFNHTFLSYPTQTQTQTPSWLFISVFFEPPILHPLGVSKRDKRSMQSMFKNHQSMFKHHRVMNVSSKMTFDQNKNNRGIIAISVQPTLSNQI
ncbi:hypothetical protein EYC80_005014 [Monilinia laxa]|uniref:Uncharacterized protein n=1 Tax=Monilinia laxa TaxID=61186 RepID=A0A5N6KIY2_MONLA|nr:hypothetical protein EYC80_005014 [Monilinia laxa]